MKNFNLPQDYRPYIDKYFLRAKEILKKENLNPIVKAQVFIRKGDCKVYGIDEAIAVLKKYSNSKNMKIYALKEGDYFKSGETLMTIEAPIQDIIDLETMYLGVLSAETTLQNGGQDINLIKIAENMSAITKLIGDRPVSYFGARHWRYDRDYDIAKACFIGGAKNCSTDCGAIAFKTDGKGIGTIPHALEAIYHWKDGLNSAVSNATLAFHMNMPKEIPRIALVDYANMEIDDTLTTNAFVDIDGIRIDTCGENMIQGQLDFKIKDYPYKYWFGKGVTCAGVASLIKRLELRDKSDKKHGQRIKPKLKIVLSSGFGNPEKVKAFIKCEKMLNMKLFDVLGIGGVFESRMATMDIIEVDGKEIHKVGRNPKPTTRLKKVI